MKTYTSIEQSKKLSKILPAETADMCYIQVLLAGAKYGEYIPYIGDLIPAYGQDKIKCWSLAALLNIIPKHIKQNDGRTYKFHVFNDDGIVIQRWECYYIAKDYHNRAEYLSDPTLKYTTNIYSNKHEDIIDACYEIIIKLHEQNLL